MLDNGIISLRILIRKLLKNIALSIYLLTQYSLLGKQEVRSLDSFTKLRRKKGRLETDIQFTISPMRVPRKHAGYGFTHLKIPHIDHCVLLTIINLLLRTWQIQRGKPPSSNQVFAFFKPGVSSTWLARCICAAREHLQN